MDVELFDQKALFFANPLEKFHVGDVAQQDLLEVIHHLIRAVEHMVKPVAQQASPRPGHQAEQHPQGEVAGDRGLDRFFGNTHRGNHFPGNALLGNLQLEVFFGLEEGGEVAVGDRQFLLQGFVLLDQLGLVLKNGVELGLLLPGHRQGELIGLQGASYGFELALTQDRHQPLPAGF